uniref:FHA domain-containing protein n=1 Tax=Sphenodon punctatus TaxID=8508 RepID=A0A8D0HBT7_SPHPU
MEQTQPLEWEEEEEEEGRLPLEAVVDPPKPVGCLHLLSSKYGPEKDFWIYPGENVIGRLESSRVCLPFPSVSKAHAVIEVPAPDGPHLLYDQGSLNRTRRQRSVLLPYVRYSLVHKDALLFGDVGCQYFLLPPGDASADDSLEVPPTQPRTLVVEETPAPARRMGYGGVLARDSDEEEGGSLLQLSASSRSDSSSKGSSAGPSKLALSLFSPSATVVPESDEEDRDPSPGTPACPTLRLSYNSDGPDLGASKNGAAQEMTEHAVPEGKEQGPTLDPSLAAFHLDSDTDVEEETASSVPKTPALGSQRNRLLPKGGSSDVGQERSPLLAIDSDTDVEEPDVTCLGSHPMTENGDSGTDVEDEEVAFGTPKKPAVEVTQNGQPPGSTHPVVKPGMNCLLATDGDTDVEEAAEDPDVACSQGCQPVQDGGSDTDVEVATGKPDAVCPENHQPAITGDSDTDVEESMDCPHVAWADGQCAIPKNDTNVESVVDHPELAQSQRCAISGDGNTGEETMGEPDVLVLGTCHRVRNGDGNPEMESSEVKGEKPHVSTSSGAHGTDVEEAAPGNPDVLSSHMDNTDVEKPDVLKSHGPSRGCRMAVEPTTLMREGPDVACLPSCQPGTPDGEQGVVVEGSPVVAQQKGSGPVGGLESNAAVGAENPDVGPQQSHSAAVETPRIPQKSHQLASFSGDSDTDVEEAVENPDVPQMSHQGATFSVDSDTDVEEAVENPDVLRESALPDKSHQLAAISVDSDTDVEEDMKNPDVESQKNHALAEGGGSDTDVEEGLGNPDVEPQKSHVAEDGDSDTDVEEGLNNADAELQKNHVLAADGDSDTDVEEAALSHQDPEARAADPDVATPSPGIPKGQIDTLSTPGRSPGHGDKQEPYVRAGYVGGQETHRSDLEEEEEEDPNVALQMTQCYLPDDVLSSVGEEANKTAAAGKEFVRTPGFSGRGVRVTE